MLALLLYILCFVEMIHSLSVLAGGRRQMYRLSSIDVAVALQELGQGLRPMSDFSSCYLLLFIES